jgi:signal transduction histidine kinase
VVAGVADDGGLLLRNRFPLLLWWGPELVQFYNDAYRPIPGDKHPRCLGQAARECWPEIWDVIGPMIEAPFSGLPATWSDDLLLVIMRSGFPEETHFKVAYSPVPDETVAGTGIGGVLATVSEITAQTRAYEEAHERADRAKTLVFSNVSHEFRTPLALMLGPTQDAVDRRRREAHGFDAHLLKPVDLKTLSSLLASLLQGQDAS